MAWTEILTTAEMRALEQAAIDGGAVTGLELMERAGVAVADQIRLRWPKAGRVTVLCGPGNNGGDGYVVARLLAQAEWRVRVLGMDNTPGADAAEMKRRWTALGEIGPLTSKALGEDPGDLVVDAMFGTGMTRPLDHERSLIARWLGGWSPFWVTRPPPIVAIDGVSGLCLDSGAWLGAERGDLPASLPRAALTVTFHTAKPGHFLEIGPLLGGELVVADIGLKQGPRPSPDAGLQLPGRVAALMRRPSHHSWDEALPRLGKSPIAHKFSNGHALVIAGTAGHGGAARLAARAALRIGAGLVTICPPGSALIEHVGAPDALMRAGVDDADDLAALLSDPRIGAVAIGPGCGVERAGMMLDAALACERRLVLDADALTALSRRAHPFDGLHQRCVLTPHAGEFARLFPEIAGRLAGQDTTARLPPGATEIARQIERQTIRARFRDQHGPLYSKLDATREAAALSGALVLLKGPDTVIAAPDGQARIHSAYDVPWLATAGAGDVLAGIIAGLLARGLDPLDAAATGALLHAAAARRFGPGLIADDLPDQLPRVFRDMGL